MVSKNSNGDGSVYFEPPSPRADGTVTKGRWRATYVDLDGRIKRVSGPTRALAESRRDELVTAAAPIRLGVAVTLLFCQGWRVSEVLGLAWDDLDLEAGTAHIRRAATHSTTSGVTFGPTKTSGAQGLHHLAPIAVAQLRAIVCSRQPNE